MLFDILVVLENKVLLLKCFGYQRKKTKLICDLITTSVPVEIDLTKIMAVYIGERK